MNEADLYNLLYNLTNKNCSNSDKKAEELFLILLDLLLNKKIIGKREYNKLVKKARES